MAGNFSYLFFHQSGFRYSTILRFSFLWVAPKDQRISPRRPPAAAAPSAPAEAPAKTYSDAFKGMSFGKSTQDSQEVFQIRLLKPNVVILNKDVIDSSPRRSTVVPCLGFTAWRRT